MRNKSIIFLLSFVVVFAMASVNMPVPQGKKTKKAKASAVVVDTLLKGQGSKDSKAVIRIFQIPRRWILFSWLSIIIIKL